MVLLCFSGEDNIKTEEPKQEQAKPADATEVVIFLNMKCMNCSCWVKSSMLFCLFQNWSKGLEVEWDLDSMPRRGRQIPLNSIAWFHQEDGIKDNWIQSYIVSFFCITFLLLYFVVNFHVIKYFMLCNYIMIWSDMLLLLYISNIQINQMNTKNSQPNKHNHGSKCQHEKSKNGKIKSLLWLLTLQQSKKGWFYWH